jgi:hypothetical protein
MTRPRQAPRRRLTPRAAATLGLAFLAAAIGAPAASAVSAQLKEEFAPFLDCPTATATVCTVAQTTSGEFKMGSKDVPIEKTITLQGGLPISSLQDQQFVPARDGDTLISPAQKVPGGLLGIGLLEGIGGEVTATATLAGPASDIVVNQFFLAEGGGTAVVLPLKIKLDNPLLGSECSIGSDSEPVVLHLVDASKGTLTDIAKGKITKISGNSLEDHTFAVPAAKNCGLSTVLVNLLAGLPSAAGHNKAVMSGSFQQTAATWAQKYVVGPQEKKEAKEEKEREKRERKEEKERAK